MIYEKADMHAEAMDVLLLNIESLERASEYAARVNEAVVWSKLGKSYIGAGQVGEGIDCYLKAEDSGDFLQVIEVAQREDAFEELVRFLKMARNKVKDQRIDSELVYSYAKTGALPELEEFVTGNNIANTQQVGDRLFGEGNFQAAKILFMAISNNAKLASCFVSENFFRNSLNKSMYFKCNIALQIWAIHKKGKT